MVVKIKQFLVVIYSWALKTCKPRTNRLEKTTVVKMEQFLVVIYSWALKTRKTRTNRLKKSWWLKQNSFWWLFTVGL